MYALQGYLSCILLPSLISVESNSIFGKGWAERNIITVTQQSALHA